MQLDQLSTIQPTWVSSAVLQQRLKSYPDDFPDMLWGHVLLLSFHVAVLAFFPISLCVQLLPFPCLCIAPKKVTAYVALMQLRTKPSGADLLLQKSFWIQGLWLLNRCWWWCPHDRVSCWCCTTESLGSVRWWGRGPRTPRSLHAVRRQVC